jgi:site-specific DNA recombinase
MKRRALGVRSATPSCPEIEKREHLTIHRADALGGHNWEDRDVTIGANIQRPAFQRLMQDVEAGKVDIVVVYKVDRLSRSLLDFAKLMDRFNRTGVAFVSVTQNFSTADAMGCLTLNVLMNFAEFEREMIGERTRDKMAAARRKGKWTGGPPPLGYDVVDRKLVVNEAEAALVRRLYDLYLDLRSAVAVARALNAECRTTKHHVSITGTSHGARAWDKPAVLKVLRNPIPAGLMA